MFKLNKSQLLGYRQNVFATNQTMLGEKNLSYSTDIQTTTQADFSTDANLDQLAVCFVQSYAKVGVKLGLKFTPISSD